MRAYFLSDLHLGAPYTDDCKTAERRVVAFLDHIKKDADVIYLLGDILDYWYEYKYVVPRGYVRFFGKLAELSDSGVRIVWFIGNHDIWIRDYIPNELGIEVHDGWKIEELEGTKFFLTHGDGVGKMKPAFRIMRKIFRNKFCQFLFNGINPRWTIPFAFAWSDMSRKKGEKPFREVHPILNNLVDFTREFHITHPDIRYFIYGHLHILRKIDIAPDCEMYVIGEWLHRFSFGQFDGKVFTLWRWEDGAVYPANAGTGKLPG